MSAWEIPYDEWYREKDPLRKREAMSKLLKVLTPYLQSEANKWKGNMSPFVIDAEVKKLAIEAIKSYTPGASALPTHISNRIKKVSRLVMTSGTGAMRVPEGTLASMGAFKNSWSTLESRYGREPTLEEMEDELALPRHKVEQLFKKNQTEGFFTESNDNFVISPVYTNIGKNRLDVVYFDLNPQEKRIMEGVFGYGGKPVKSTSQLASELKVSPGYISQKKKVIEDKMREALGG